MKRHAISILTLLIFTLVGCTTATNTPTPTSIPATATVPTITPTAASGIDIQETLMPSPIAKTVICPTSGTIQVGTDATYAPFESINPQNKRVEGFDIDLLNALLGKMNLKPVIHNATFETIFQALSITQYDLVISAATITPERQQLISFTNPYFESGQVVIIRQSDRTQYRDSASLSNVIGGAETGTTSADAAATVTTKPVKTYDNVPKALIALSQKEIDFVVADATVAYNFVAATTGNKLAVISNLRLTTEFYGISVRKNCPELLAMLNTQLNAYIESGNYAALYQSYFGDDASADYQPKARHPTLQDALQNSQLSSKATLAATGSATAPAAVNSPPATLAATDSATALPTVANTLPATLAATTSATLSATATSNIEQFLPDPDIIVTLAATSAR